MNNTEVYFKNLEIIIKWIENADNKAGSVLTLNTALIVISGFIFSKIMNNLDTFTGTFQIAVTLICLFFISSFVLSTLSAFRVLLPDIKPKGKEKLFFFGSISKMNLDEYKAKMLSISEQDISSNLLEQIHINSEIASNKFDHLRTSWRLMATSLFFGVLMGLLSLI